MTMEKISVYKTKILLSKQKYLCATAHKFKDNLQTRENTWHPNYDEGFNILTVK